MGAKLTNCDDKQTLKTNLWGMKDGQVGIIVSWGDKKSPYIGRIVQRHDDHLISIGQPYGGCWVDIFKDHAHACWSDGIYHVRLLEPTELISVTQPE